jgi:RNA polymerase sigma-70 factor, ECF subfamily
MAFRLLLEQLWRPLIAHATRMLGNRDAAEDVVQEAFVRLWERREQWQLQGSVRALLYQITHNLAIDEQRRRRASDRWIERGTSMPVRRAVTPLEQLEERDLRVAFARAVDELPERRREVFLLVRRAELSYHEAAEVLGLAPQTVANHLSLALADLRDSLQGFLDPSLPS